MNRIKRSVGSISTSGSVCGNKTKRQPFLIWYRNKICLIMSLKARGGKRSGSGIQYCSDKRQILGQNLCKLPPFHTGTRNMAHIPSLIMYPTMLREWLVNFSSIAFLNLKFRVFLKKAVSLTGTKAKTAHQRKLTFVVQICVVFQVQSYPALLQDINY